jgi:hypothetical protein
MKATAERWACNADEESDGCIVPVKPRTMPSDIGGGDGGGKAAGRGEGELRRMPRTQRRITHVTEAASPRIGAAWVPNTPKADLVRPETGAGCGKAARPDLRGGRGAILVPTATLGRLLLLRRSYWQTGWEGSSECFGCSGVYRERSDPKRAMTFGRSTSGDTLPREEREGLLQSFIDLVGLTGF